MSYFKHFIIITIFFLSTKSHTYKILQKYGKVEKTNGIVIFESKDFSEGDNMYFKIKRDGKCDGDLEYGYFSTIEEIGSASSTSYYAEFISTSTTSINGVTSYTNYFTIIKKSEEYKDSNGNYLLLQIDCNNVDFENTEKDGSKYFIIIIIIVLVLFFAMIGIIIGVSYYRRRKRAMMKNAYINQTPMIMYGAPQQGNMVYMYGGQQSMVQPNRIPYNNSNIQYSNILNNTPSGLAAQNNAAPQQNYNMVPQSSADRGYNSNVVNEKVM